MKAPIKEQFKRQLKELVEDNNFRKLQQKVVKFNPFKIMKTEDYEIRHSNFLAWILNPNENHMLNDAFIKKFFNIIGINSVDFSKLSIEREFTDDSVSNSELRKKNRYDILLISEESVILIENKIYSDESDEQLIDYHNTIENKYKSHEFFGVFLTLEGVPASETSFKSISYKQIYSIMADVIITNKVEPSIRKFIEYYLEILEEKVFIGETQNLCSDIIKNYPDTRSLDKGIQSKVGIDISEKKTLDIVQNYQKRIDTIINTTEIISAFHRAFIEKRESEFYWEQNLSNNYNLAFSSKVINQTNENSFDTYFCFCREIDTLYIKTNLKSKLSKTEERKILRIYEVESSDFEGITKISKMIKDWNDEEEIFKIINECLDYLDSNLGDIIQTNENIFISISHNKN